MPPLSFDSLGRLDQSTDFGLNLYRQPSFRPSVIRYYQELTGNLEVTLAVLAVCDKLNLAPTLAFSLAWSESRFDPRALNYNPGSVDRGLYQLNSRSFPHVTRAQSLDPALNAKLGLAYFKKHLELSRDVKTALAMYNAGAARISSGDTPATTLKYMERTTAFWSELEQDFLSHVFLSSPQLSLNR